MYWARNGWSVRVDGNPFHIFLALVPLGHRPSGRHSLNCQVFFRPVIQFRNVTQASQCILLFSKINFNFLEYRVFRVDNSRIPEFFIYRSIASLISGRLYFLIHVSLYSVEIAEI
jgi:hypothetical protein